ncbi:MAG: hypothetical protein F6K37_01350 [Moorea sp. SIO4E2]|uniref:hypothetical protein n=1 Tax=Moorena sp. SIO4E2 TaxID=2607826 RepID=UPI0013BA32D1|nr:hypothetical protein [Moorena sp. SIO4E2]NEQ04684.1 hypothetical protein [Moorena sp. SIO4E2]
MNIIYRMYREADQADLISLWSEDSQWGKIDAQKWKDIFLRPSLEPAQIVVAEDSNIKQIVGQFAFIPWRTLFKGRTVMALRPFAPIIKKQYRGSLQTVIDMYRYGVQQLRSQYQLLYMLPDPLWVPLFRRIPSVVYSTFPLWGIPLPLNQPFTLPEGYTASLMEEWDERVDHLWTQASQLHEVMVVRNRTALMSKSKIFNSKVTAVEYKGELIGLGISGYKGDPQWLICDLLTVDTRDSLRATLMAVCNLAHTESLAPDLEKPLRRAAMLMTPSIEPIASSLGFSDGDYEFPMVVQILDSTLTKEDAAPKNWYVSAND